MNATVCLGFSYNVIEFSRDESAVSEFTVRKHQAAMKRAHEILCPDLRRRSKVEEALDSVRARPWLDV